MSEKRVETPPAVLKEKKPRTFPIRVPGETGLYEDFRRVGATYIGKVEEFFPMEEGKEWIKLRWSRDGRRRHAGLVWTYVPFKDTILRDGKEVEIERSGWFATKPRTEEERKKGKPLLFLISGDTFIPGPEPAKRKPRRKRGMPTAMQRELPMPTKRE